jgi:hypothetical protein
MSFVSTLLNKPCESCSFQPQDAEEREFVKNLKMFMRKRGTPIEKIPALGFRKSMEILLYYMVYMCILHFQ